MFCIHGSLLAQFRVKDRSMNLGMSIEATTMPPAISHRDSRWPLSPARDVLVEGEHFQAASNEPWLQLENIEDLIPGSIVRIRYSSNFFDDPVRPILRFWQGEDKYQDNIMPSPYSGAGLWVGRIPHGVTTVWISPTAQAGLFDFLIEAIEAVSWAFMARKAFASPRRAFYAVITRLAGLHEDADANLRWVLGWEPMTDYASWKAARSGGVMVPRTDWSKGPIITFVIHAGDAEASTVEITCKSILEQSYFHWRAVFRGEPGTGNTAANQQAWLRDPWFQNGWEQYSDASGLLCLLAAGDALEPHALACFVEHFARHPGQTIVYADDIVADVHGKMSPRFKPNWSSTLHGYFSYVGRAVIFRETTGGSRIFEDHGQPADDRLRNLLDSAKPECVGHIRRSLFRFPASSAGNALPQIKGAGKSTVPPDDTVTVIVPTRDRADLLEPCLSSILNASSHKNFDILVIDNDSRKPATQNLFARFTKQDPRIRVVKYPGPFNFAAICNNAVSQARGRFIVFLNNDTTIITPDWIEKLLSFAERPDVGAVGARLLYPSRLLQHAGLVLGMGGLAGHFGAHSDSGSPGWHSRNHLPHETSAVTGACLMVEKNKFLACGGFDQTHLPIELNDIDLCLRLAGRGWRTICDSRVELFHYESASRGGASLRLQRVYQQERAYFSKRWRETIRDDPFFNPALSLYAYSAQLS